MKTVRRTHTPPQPTETLDDVAGAPAPTPSARTTPRRPRFGPRIALSAGLAMLVAGSTLALGPLAAGAQDDGQWHDLDAIRCPDCASPSKVYTMCK